FQVWRELPMNWPQWNKQLNKILIATVLFACGCAHAPESGYQAYQQKQKDIIAQFNQANKIMDDGQFKQAAKAYDNIGLNDPVGQLDLIIIFNAGSAYYQAGDCRTAGERLRGVVRLAGKMAPQIKY